MFKRLFLSHKLTGIPDDELRTTLLPLKHTLMRFAEEVFCSYEHMERMKEQGMTARENYAWCLQQQTSCDGVVAFLHYEEESRGMRQELEAAEHLKQPYIVLERHFVDKPVLFRVFEEQAKYLIEYETFADLLSKLRMLKSLPSFEKHH